MTAPVLEVCVDTLAGLEAAVSGGADRIELCAALSLGGLTPPAGVMARAVGCGVPVMAMIRPRAGDFRWSESELLAMEADIAAVRAAGLAGVVLGASMADGTLDGAALGRLMQAARGLDVTLHRCFDLVPDMDAALELAVGLGIRRILTSGGARTAAEGAARITHLVARAAGRVSIMPGAGVTAENALTLMALCVTELHGSCSVPVGGPADPFGFAPPGARRTDAGMVRAVKRAMRGEG